MKWSKGNSKPRTLLQNIACRRNWLLNFTLQKFHLQNQPDLKLSKDTLELTSHINYLIGRLKFKVDRDWRTQKRLIEEEKKRKEL